jgi:hypothetical protein
MVYHLSVSDNEIHGTIASKKCIYYNFTITQLHTVVSPSCSVLRRSLHGAAEFHGTLFKCEPLVPLPLVKILEALVSEQLKAVLFTIGLQEEA